MTYWLNRFLITLSAVFLLLFSYQSVALADGTGTINQLNPWKTIGGPYLTPVNSVVGLKIPSLANQTCLGTDSDGIFGAGTCSGGGGVTGGTAGMLASWVNSSTLTATSTPTARAYIATSTTATSTFAGPVKNGNGDIFSQQATFIVATSTRTGQYTDLQSALNALPSTGGKIHVRCGTYTLSASTTIAGSHITIEGEGDCTQFNFDGTSVNPAFNTSDTTQRTDNVFKDFLINQTSVGGAGTAINASHFARSTFDHVNITGANIGMDFANVHALYNRVQDPLISVQGSGSVGIRFTNTANDNQVYSPRIVTDANSTGIYFDAHSNTCYSCDVETGALVGIDITANGNNTTLVNPYLEANITNLRLASGVQSVTMLGGYISTGSTANITDNGAVGFAAMGTRVQFLPVNYYMGADFGLNTINQQFRLEVGTTTGQNVMRINGVSSANGAPVASLFRKGSVEWVLAAGGGASSNFMIGANPAGGGTSDTDTNLLNAAKFTITTAGNTGISTTTPWGKLAVNLNSGETNPYAFTIASSTASATSTLFQVSNTGSTTILSILNVPQICLSGDCKLAWPTGGSGVWPWTTATTFATSTNSTTTPGWFKLGLFASSTSQFDNASTTFLTASNFWMPGQSAGCAQYDANGKLTSTGSNCGTGSGGSGNIATSTADTANQVVTFTSTNATPATIGGSSNLTFSGTTLTAGAFQILGTTDPTLQATNGALTIKADHNHSGSNGSLLTLQGGAATSLSQGNGGDVYLTGGAQDDIGTVGRVYVTQPTTANRVAFNVDSLTAARSVTFPNFSGTLCLKDVNCAATTSANTWSALQTFGNASSTLFSSSGTIYANNLTVTGTCTGCGTGSSGPATSTNPLMATYFVSTSTIATSTFNGDNLFTKYVKIGSTTCASVIRTFLDICGNDNTTAGVQAGLSNPNSGSSAYSFLYFNNDATAAQDNNTHYGGFQYNSSNYTDTTFGTAIGVPQQFSMWATDGPLTLLAASSTSNNSYINFLTGGPNTTNERMRIASNGAVSIGSSTPFLGGSLTLGSSTAVVTEELNLATSTSMSLGVGSSSVQHIDYSTSAVTITISNYKVVPGMSTTVYTCGPNSGTAGAITWAVGAGLALKAPSGTVAGNTTLASSCDMWLIGIDKGSLGSTTPWVWVSNGGGSN